MKKFIQQISLFSIVVGILIWLIGTIFLTAKTDSVTWMIYSYFILLTLIFHYGLLRSSEGRPQAFIRYYMGSTTLKLLLHIGIIVLYSIFHKEDAVRFIVTFLCMYILFTGFEVTVVWREFGKKS